MTTMSNTVLALLDTRNEELVAWHLGVQAGSAGLPISASPFHPLDEEVALGWLDGHAEAVGTILESTRPEDL